MVSRIQFDGYIVGNDYLETTQVQIYFLCGIRFSFRVRVRVRVRLKIPLTRLTLGVLHAFVREWLANSHLHVRLHKSGLCACARMRDMCLAESGTSRI